MVALVPDLHLNYQIKEHHAIRTYTQSPTQSGIAN